MGDRKSEFYKNQIILAPMVRMGTLPLRLLSLDYGADIVYCEELIDYKLIQCDRKVNDVLGTVDFVDKSDGTVVFRTCFKEREKVVLQIGTNSPERAAQVALLVQNDVAGIDINMGCPKEFSVRGGMGSALLDDVEKAYSIVKAVTEVATVPVTCKIRLLPDTEKTIKFCKMLENAGAAAIAVHGRTRYERPQHSNRNHVLKQLSQSQLKIPIIANGGSREIEKYEDIEKFKEETGCASVMIARAAQYNCSIFRKEGKLPRDQVIISYLRYAVDYDSPPANAKYCIQNMLRELQSTEKGQKFLETQTLEQMCELWDLRDYCRKKQSLHFHLGDFGRWEIMPKRQKIEFSDGSNQMLSLRCAFIRNLYQNDEELPKTRLLILSRKKQLPPPKYETVQVDKLFSAIVTFDEKRYTSLFWEKNKRSAEQGAAIVCLYALGMYTLQELESKGVVR